MTTIFLFVVLFVLMFLGIPIAIALGLSSVLTILLFAPDSLASLSLKFFQTMENFTLMAIPFFILSGAFLTTGGVGRLHLEGVVAHVAVGDVDPGELSRGGVHEQVGDVEFVAEDEPTQRVPVDQVDVVRGEVMVEGLPLAAVQGTRVMDGRFIVGVQDAEGQNASA